MHAALLQVIVRWRVHLLLFGLLALSYLYILPRWADWNQNSRFNLVLALVNDGTVTIDRYVENTGDYAYYGGHYYSDKAPGLSLLGAPVYAVFRWLAPGPALERWQAAAQQSRALSETLRPDGTGLRPDKIAYFLGLVVTTAVTVAFPSALLGVLIFVVAADFVPDVRARLAIALLYGLATSAFPYANTFVGHQPSAFLLFAAFALLLAIRRRGWPRRWLMAVGLLLGYAAITEYPAALIGGVLAAYALWTLGRPLTSLALLALGGLPPLVALAVYDYAAFGTLLPIGYFHSALWSDVHSTGLVSLTYPRPEALWGITFGIHRGLFVLSPYLLFAAPGYWALWRRQELRAEWWVLAAAPLLFLLFNGSSAMWQGGFAIGPRYFLPALPFLALVAGAGLYRAWRHALFRPVIAVACGWSLVAVWAQTLGGQSFPDYTPNPLVDLSLPRLASGDVARNLGMAAGLAGWASLLPLLAALVVAGSALLALGGEQPRDRQTPLKAGEGRVRWAAK
jgi:hypothetical protein